jgi:Putative transposase/Transposase zinc-binding domain
MDSKNLLQQFAEATRHLWNRDTVRQAVRDNLDKVTKCRTPFLGAEQYASDDAVKDFCHTCKSRFCTCCGHRATLLWQREQWCALPDVRYSEICFTMPNVLWPLIRDDRRLLDDIAALGASVIRRWVQAHHGVLPLILVVPHTFGRRLNFHPHLHILVSAGGLNKCENHWLDFRHFDKHALMYWWRFAVSNYLIESLRTKAVGAESLTATVQLQEKRPWNIHIKRFSSKAHFLRYAGRYLRRPPIAEHRIISVTDHHVEFWANDLKLKAWVRIRVSVEEFLALLIQHIPDRYVHGIRYFGLLSPSGKHRLSDIVFSLLGQRQRPRPKRLPWAKAIERDFGYDPLIDSHGGRMRWVGRKPPISTAA